MHSVNEWPTEQPELPSFWRPIIIAVIAAILLYFHDQQQPTDSNPPIATQQPIPEPMLTQLQK